MCTTASRQEPAPQPRELRSVLCDDLEGWDGGGREVQEGGNVCVHMTNLDSVLKTKGITLPIKVYIYNQSYGFSSSHVRL